MIKLTFKLIKTGQKHIYEHNLGRVILTPPPVNNGCKKAQKVKAIGGGSSHFFRFLIYYPILLPFKLSFQRGIVEHTENFQSKVRANTVEVGIRAEANFPIQ